MATCHGMQKTCHGKIYPPGHFYCNFPVSDHPDFGAKVFKAYRIWLGLLYGKIDIALPLYYFGRYHGTIHPEKEVIRLKFRKY
jgi:hypothetical protein